MAIVYHGSHDGPVGSVSLLPKWRAYGGQASAALGTSVASAGDVNGDGYSDVIIGAPGNDNGQADEGGAFVWLGSTTGLSGDTGTTAHANWSAESDQAESGFGGSVASAGDVNGDGYADVAVGAKDFDFPEEDEGAVFVWHGSASGLGDSGTPANSDWREDGDTDNASLGNSVASAGDVNRDGFSDLIAGGAYLAAVWHGSSSGLSSLGVDWVQAGSQPTALFGYSVSTAGDVNGDGYSDVVIGAPLQTGTQSNEGGAWAYCGGASGLESTACWADLGGSPLSFFGWSVSSAGDLNGDGYSDIAVGAPSWTDGETAEGQVRVYYGSAWGPVSYNGGDWAYESDVAYANVGFSVAAAGDVTGDGFGDLIVGAPHHTWSQDYEGRMLVFYGTGSIGRQVLPRQMRTDFSTAVAPLGRSDSQSAFGIQLRASSPSGRGEVKVSEEVKPLDTEFDGTLRGVASWTDTGLTGVTSQQTATGLDEGSAYHWRARVQHSPVTSPFDPPFSRWYHVPWSGWNEADLRTSRPGLFVVDSDADDWQAHDIHPGDGVCADERGNCTLRAAIEEANAHHGPDVIEFSSPMHIALNIGEGPLPDLTGTVNIDASGVWDFGDDTPGITLDGSDQIAYGLTLHAPVCGVFGLHVTGFADDGVLVLSDHNAIGSPLPGMRNVLSGNHAAGVHLEGTAAHGNQVRANYIGLAPDGVEASPNGYGVLIDGGAADNVVGGEDPSDGNIVSGNSGDGVRITGAGTDRNLIAANVVGPSYDGSEVPGNGNSGVYVGSGAKGTLVGSDSGRGNLIRGGTSAGVTVAFADETIVQFSFVIYNAGSGVSILHSRNCTVRNSLIANNSGYGIDVIGADIGSGSSSGVSGTACAGCLISVCSDDADQGRIIHAFVDADPVTGAWTYTGPISGPFVTALATGFGGNTSEYSAPFELGAGSTFVVDSDRDSNTAHDSVPGDGICRSPLGDCTLRAAVDESNALPGNDMITFARSMTIVLDTWGLPGLTLDDTVTIDAGSVWNTSADMPGVDIDAGHGALDVLTVNASGCAIHGLHVANASGMGIVITSADNVIGGSGAGRGNFLTGHTVGLMITGGGARQNEVSGNYIGMVPELFTATGNGTGVIVADGASATVIGGVDLGDANLILGNSGRGILVQDSGTTTTVIVGNGIGVTLSEPRFELGNGSDGVSVYEGPTGTRIGGPQITGNVISGNGRHGVFIKSAGDATVIAHNAIELSAQSGVMVEDTSDCQIAFNTIASNGEAGVTVKGNASAGNMILANSIHDHPGKGIELLEGANNGIAAPVVMAADPGGDRPTDADGDEHRAGHARADGVVDTDTYDRRQPDGQLDADHRSEPDRREQPHINAHTDGWTEPDERREQHGQQHRHERTEPDGRGQRHRDRRPHGHAGHRHSWRWHRHSWRWYGYTGRRHRYTGRWHGDAGRWHRHSWRWHGDADGRPDALCGLRSDRGETSTGRPTGRSAARFSSPPLPSDVRCR
jgi:hypothetical protein